MSRPSRIDTIITAAPDSSIEYRARRGRRLEGFAGRKGASAAFLPPFDSGAFRFPLRGAEDDPSIGLRMNDGGRDQTHARSNATRCSAIPSAPLPVPFPLVCAPVDPFSFLFRVPDERGKIRTFSSVASPSARACVCACVYLRARDSSDRITRHENVTAATRSRLERGPPGVFLRGVSDTQNRTPTGVVARRRAGRETFKPPDEITAGTAGKFPARRLSCRLHAVI